MPTDFEKKISCTVEILTRNSEATLRRCLESVKDFAEILVLDGNSTDGTLEIAREFECKIMKQYDTEEPDVVIGNYAEVRNKGLRLASYDWFMFIDSDEYLSDEAVAEIRTIVASQSPQFFAWWQPRKYVLDGKIVSCATTYPNRQVRLFNRKHANEFIKPIHERVKLRAGATVGQLQGFEYIPVESLSELNLQWMRYMDVELRMNDAIGSWKQFKLAVRNICLFGMYVFRYLRNLIFCRGLSMPVTYEWTRHKYLLYAAWHLLLRSVKK